METKLTKPENWLKLVAGAVGLVFDRVKPVARNGQAAIAVALASPDDLTLIHGIGPTFARRLRDAGITTYVQLASYTPEELQTITKAAVWQANPTDWVAQAREKLN